MFSVVICLFLATPLGLQDLSFPATDWTQASAVKTPKPNHWTARKFLPLPLFLKKNKKQKNIIIFATYSSLSSFGCKVSGRVKQFFLLPYQFGLKVKDKIETNG